MRRFAGTVALVIPFLAALACGGRVGVVGGGGGGTCPSPSAVTTGAACPSAGQTCESSFSACGTPETAECSCTDGTWACPAFNGPACVVQCPPTNGVQPGSSCDLAEESPCTVTLTSTGCDGTQLTSVCTCQSDGEEGAATWGCSQPVLPECADAHPPGCPDPSSVVQGNGCDVSPQLSCNSETPVYDCNGTITGDAPCQCFGGEWSCITSEPDCPPTGCPDPQSVEQGVSCMSPGLQCPGNPTECDGAVFYDAFECDSGEWNDIAVTGCSGSGSSGGGSGSSSGSSGGGAIDAGPPDTGPPDAKGI